MVGTVVRLIGPMFEKTRPAGFGEAESVTDATPASVASDNSASYVVPRGATRKPSPPLFPPSKTRTAIGTSRRNEDAEHQRGERSFSTTRTRLGLERESSLRQTRRRPRKPGERKQRYTPVRFSNSREKLPGHTKLHR